MRLRLSIDRELFERARAVAAGRGQSLNELIRELLEAQTGQQEGDARAEALDDLWETSSGHSDGARVSREDAYEDRAR